MRFLYAALIIPVILVLRTVMDNAVNSHLSRFFVFDHARLQEIVKESINELNIDYSAEQIMTSVHAKLQAEYPGYIEDLKQESWVFNNAGNAMGTMIVLHASLTEYLIFFGSAVGTEGHTGMHLANDYFTILYGEELAALPYSSKPERYLPGDQHLLPYGQVKQYRIPPGSFALELAQGYIPTMLPFGMIEVLTSTFDYQTFFKTAKISAVLMISNLLKGKI